MMKEERKSSSLPFLLLLLLSFEKIGVQMTFIHESDHWFCPDMFQWTFFCQFRGPSSRILIKLSLSFSPSLSHPFSLLLSLTQIVFLSHSRFLTHPVSLSFALFSLALRLSLTHTVSFSLTHTFSLTHHSLTQSLSLILWLSLSLSLSPSHFHALTTVSDSFSHSSWPFSLILTHPFAFLQSPFSAWTREKISTFVSFLFFFQSDSSASGLSLAAFSNSLRTFSF